MICFLRYSTYSSYRFLCINGQAPATPCVEVSSAGWMAWIQQPESCVFLKISTCEQRTSLQPSIGIVGRPFFPGLTLWFAVNGTKLNVRFSWLDELKWYTSRLSEDLRFRCGGEFAEKPSEALEPRVEHPTASFWLRLNLLFVIDYSFVFGFGTFG